MNPKLLLAILFFGITSTFAQTKVSGYVFDEANQPISFANVIFKGSTQGTITDENGKFYMESNNTWTALNISFLGYETLDVPLTKRVNYDLRITLKEAAEQLSQVFIVAGKQPKKNNPAIDLLRKIWEHKRKNGLKHFKQYEYNKY